MGVAGRYGEKRAKKNWSPPAHAAHYLTCYPALVAVLAALWQPLSNPARLPLAAQAAIVGHMTPALRAYFRAIVLGWRNGPSAIPRRDKAGCEMCHDVSESFLTSMRDTSIGQKKKKGAIEVDKQTKNE